MNTKDADECSTDNMVEWQENKIMPIPNAVCQEVRARSDNRCEGIYMRISGEVERVGDCPCNGRFPLVFAHIKHREAASRDTANNIL
jgi:hypothetical protein